MIPKKKNFQEGEKIVGTLEERKAHTSSELAAAMEVEIVGCDGEADVRTRPQGRGVRAILTHGPWTIGRASRLH